MLSYKHISLHLAARKGDLQEVIRLVNAGYSIHKTDLFGSTPLHIAAMYGHLNVVAYLIGQGAKINAQTYHEKYQQDDGKIIETSYSPLDLAVQYAPNLETIEYLLKRQANSYNWKTFAPFLLEEIMESAFEMDDKQFDLSLSKLTTLTQFKDQMLWVNLESDEKPLGALLMQFATAITDVDYYNRLQATISDIDAIDALSSSQRYIRAKNLLHVFPSDNEYLMYVGNHKNIILAEGSWNILTTDFASRSLQKYYQQLLDAPNDQKWDIPINHALFSHIAANHPPVHTISDYYEIKQTIFQEVANIYTLSALAAHTAGLPDTSELLYQQYLNGHTILLPTGWIGHGFEIVINKDLNILMIANAGDRFPQLTPGLHAYHYHFEIGMQDIYDILNNDDKTELEFKRFYDLGLEPIDAYSFQTPAQSYNNCAWYSHLIAERALIFLELSKVVSKPSVAQDIAEIWFNQVDQFQKNNALNEYFEMPSLEVAALSDILIDYHHTLKTPEEKERAKLIFDYLINAEHKVDFLKYYQAHKLEFSPEISQWIKVNKNLYQDHMEIIETNDVLAPILSLPGLEDAPVSLTISDSQPSMMAPPVTAFTFTLPEEHHLDTIF